MRLDRRNLLLYAVTDRRWTGTQTLYQQVEAALKGGVTCVQLREKDLTRASLLDEARQLRELCRRHHVPFFVNDSIELALACGSDGVHVGQDDMPVREVRARVGDDMLVGVSAHTVEEARAAQADGADCLGVGAVFATGTKSDAHAVSLGTLRDICLAVDVPVVAIGGIGRDNISQLAGTGVDGVAVVSAVFGAADIEASSRELLERSLAMVGHTSSEGAQ